MTGMGHISRLLVAVLSLTILPKASVASAAQDVDLANLIDRYCIVPDGDHRQTWVRATDDGFSVLPPEDFEGLDARGVHDDTLRGFTRTIGPTEYRVLTASTWLRRPDQGTSYFRLCWVSSSLENASDVDSKLAAMASNGGFRIGKVRVFAWIPLPDGASEPVTRRTFMRSSNELARDQGMRQIISRRFERGMFVGYVSPRSEEDYRGFDWMGPPPIARPN